MAKPYFRRRKRSYPPYFILLYFPPRTPRRTVTTPEVLLASLWPLAFRTTQGTQTQLRQ